MEIIAIPVPRLKVSPQSRIGARLPDFITLMKPRVMALAVFTAVVGLMIAPGRLDPLLGTTAILAIAAGAGAAGVLNMWYDESDITSCSHAETPAGTLGNVCNSI